MSLVLYCQEHAATEERQHWARLEYVLRTRRNLSSSDRKHARACGETLGLHSAAAIRQKIVELSQEEKKLWKTLRPDLP